MQDFVRFSARCPVGDQSQAQNVLEEGHTRERAKQLTGPVFGADLVQAFEVLGSQLTTCLVFDVLLSWQDLFF